MRLNKSVNFIWFLYFLPENSKPFQYTKVNELELLATVDMAICDLRSDGKEVSVSAIKDLIGSNKEWRDKLKKDYFKDTDIRRAIERCKKLFPDKEG